MGTFVAFLKSLLETGEVVLSERPHPDSRARERAGEYLAACYRGFRLEVAGMPPGFDAEAALAASEFVWRGCWFLLERSEPPAVLERELALPPAPVTPAQHLSADVVLRYLPQVYQRARAFAPDDVLTNLLARALRQAPLSGVLADVAEGPLAPLDFGGHFGLQLLYAERLAAHEKPAWVPQQGQTLELLEWVRADRRRHVHES
jgi:hypothetical protein